VPTKDVDLGQIKGYTSVSEPTSETGMVIQSPGNSNRLLIPVFAVLFVILACLVFCCFCCRRRRNGTIKVQALPQTTQSTTLGEAKPSSMIELPDFHGDENSDKTSLHYDSSTKVANNLSAVPTTTKSEKGKVY